MLRVSMHVRGPVLCKGYLSQLGGLQCFSTSSAKTADNKMKKKAVIFDMGGVVLPGPFTFFKEFESSFGFPAGVISNAVIKNGANSSWFKLEKGDLSLEQFAEEFSKQCSEEAGQRIDMSSLLPSFHNIRVNPYPEIIDAIKCIRAEGLKTALLTNNWFISPDETFVPLDRNLFDVVVESCKVKIRKPDPQIYKMCLEQLEVSAQESIFLDDLGINLKEARSLGMTTIKVTDPQQAVSALEAELGYPLRGYVNGTVKVAKHLQLPEDKLVSYFNKDLGIESKDPPVIRSFRRGQSNPTYYIEYGDKEMVLRKKPPGKLLKSAHAVDREYRMLTTLGQFGVPVPKTLGYCNDLSIIGTEFYVMDYMNGRIFPDHKLPDIRPEERSIFYSAMIDILCKIHSVDIQKAGLSDYGKSGNYVERNFKRWVKQYEASKTDEIKSMDSLIDWIPKNLPQNEQTTIIHGDFRLDNMIFHPDTPDVVGVLDWELSTIGDPLTDLATCCLIYYLPQDFFLFAGLKDMDLSEHGIPSVEAVVAEYCRKQNIPPIDNWDFYVAFTFFRFAAICQGIYKRAISGQSSSPLSKMAGPATVFLADIGWQIASKSKLGVSTGTNKPGVRQYSTKAVDRNETSSSSHNDGKVPISVKSLPPRVQDLHKRVKAFIETNILPIEQDLSKHQFGNDRWDVNPKMEELKEKAKAEGLWNLFLPLETDPGMKYGAGLTNLEYAFLCEEMGRCLYAPEIFNCSAPDTGNMEVLVKYGNEEQKETWLKPLLDGKIRSCFAMTEPKVASSDATNIESSIDREGDYYIINGHKWWTSGACDPRCKISVFMGKTDTSEHKYRQQSMILVPMDAPGVKIVRPLQVFGYEDAPAGHAEVMFDNVKVPVSNMILGEGRGFEIAQGRLGPGRIHHCMRLIGHAERAIELMTDRVQNRVAFGRKLADFNSIQNDIAKSRIEVEQARLLVLKAAHMMDTVGNKISAPEIAMIKVIVPNMALAVIDRAIQAHGGAGVSDTTPLAAMHAWARILRIADGPDEVHLRSIAKMEFFRQEKKKLSKL